MTAKIWKDGDALYAYSVSPARLAGPVGLRLGRRRLRRRQSAKRAHEAARRGLEKRQGALHALRRGDPRRSERTLPFGQDALRRRPLGGAAAVWKDKELLYTLTDGSSYAEATAVCRFGHTLYTAGYHTDGFEEEGVVWKEGQELFDLSDGPGSGSMPYSVAVCYDDIFTAGTIFGTTRTAVVWHGDEIRYTLSDGTGHSEAYSMYVVPLYD